MPEPVEAILAEIVRQVGSESGVIGVLALAYERPMDERSRHEVEAAAGRMTTAIDASR